MLDALEAMMAPSRGQLEDGAGEFTRSSLRRMGQPYSTGSP